MIKNKLSLFVNQLFVHEQWLLTPEQFDTLKSLPSPSLFTEFSFLNCLITFTGVMIVLTWIFFGQNYGEQVFPLLRKKISTYSSFTPYILRTFTAITLIIAILGLIPREGNLRFNEITLFVPDLILNTQTMLGKLLLFFECIVAIALLSGISMRITATALFMLACLGYYAFKTAMLPYLGFFVGIALYLFFYLKRLQLAEFVLQLGTGLTFIYVGFYYKFLHPNIDIGMLAFKHAFTFGIPYDIFTFCMALVEMAAGVLILTGVLLRPLALILFFLFILLSILLKENIFAHMFIHGILLTFFINGSSRLLKQTQI